MNIGKRLALVRQSRGLTIEQVSALTSSSYDRIETGRINLKFDLLLKICDVLDIKIWDLVTEELKLNYSEKYEYFTTGVQFDLIYKKLSELTDDLRKVGNQPFATGTIKGCVFRLFSDHDCSYVCIKDGTEQGHKWPVFYSPEELEEWHEKYTA